MADNRTLHRLGDVTINLDSRRRPVKSTDRTPGPFPYYGASGIVDYVDSFLFDGLHLLVAEDGENLRSRSTRIAFLASGRFWVNNHAHVVVGNEFADTRFLAYALERLDISGYLTGSTQPKLTRAALDSIEIDLPPRAEQQAIAEVLGALDDKIVGNTAVAAAAEAHALIEFGTVCASTTVGSLVELQTTQLSPASFADKRVDHYSLPAFDVDHLPARELGGDIKSAKFLVDRPSVLISKLNPRFPRIWRAFPRSEVVSLASTEFLVLDPLEVSPALLWASLAQPSFSAQLDARVAGTSGSHQRVRAREVLEVEVRDPRTIGTVLTALLEASLEAADRARAENQTLAATRDALLPQLMSGKLRVRDAEKIVSGAGA